jgi:hypothetical protein
MNRVKNTTSLLPPEFSRKPFIIPIPNQPHVLPLVCPLEKQVPLSPHAELTPAKNILSHKTDFIYSIGNVFSPESSLIPIPIQNYASPLVYPSGKQALFSLRAAQLCIGNHIMYDQIRAVPAC